MVLVLVLEADNHLCSKIIFVQQNSYYPRALGCLLPHINVDIHKQTWVCLCISSLTCQGKYVSFNVSLFHLDSNYHNMSQDEINSQLISWIIQNFYSPINALSSFSVESSSNVLYSFLSAFSSGIFSVIMVD